MATAQELRESAVIGLWTLPVAIAAAVGGVLFLVTFEHSRLMIVGYGGYLVIPAVVGLASFAVALRKRQRSQRHLAALVSRPMALYMFIAAIGVWLQRGSQEAGFGLVAPVALPLIAASVGSIIGVVWRAWPLRSTSHHW
jgi:hypothetical protein